MLLINYMDKFDFYVETEMYHILSADTEQIRHYNTLNSFVPLQIVNCIS